MTVHVSTTYSAERVRPQAWAEFFARLPHGAELASVVVRVAPPDQVAALCGNDAVGCYRASELVIPGEQFDGEDPEEVARHEYGHHVAANRSNPPWRATEWGPKRWASAAGICRRAKDRTAFPGDSGMFYRLDPGEAFAEVYRVLADEKAGAPLSRWGLVDGSFYPDRTTLRAAERDVVDPWSRPTVARLSGRFRKSDPTSRIFALVTPLDGELTAELLLPAGRLDTLELLTRDGRVLARGLWSGTRIRRVSYVVCGQRSLRLRITASGAPGRFDLMIRRP